MHGYGASFDMGSQPMQLSQSQQMSSHQQQQQKFVMPHTRPSLQSQSMPQSLPNDPSELDDSGIGMGLMDEDLTLSKFGITGPHVGHDLVGGDMTVNVL